MAVLRSTGLIEAPLATVGAALRHTRTAETGLAGLGVRGKALTGPDSLLVPGDELRFRLGAVALTTRIERADADRLSSVLVSGPLARLRHETALTPDGTRTLLADTVLWSGPFGLPGSRLVRQVLTARLDAVRALAESWASRKVVVGTAVVHEGRLLAQQRGYPASHAGRWELPGGRVEDGEDESDAVVRECREELDVDVHPTGRLGTDVPLDNGMLLRIHTAELEDPAQQPRAVEHRAVRWLSPAELPALDWLPTDRVLLHSLRALLTN